MTVDSDVHTDITRILRDVLDEPDIELRDDTVATDIEGWDSLTHVSLMFSIEQELGVKFTDAEMGMLDNVGTLVALVERKLAAAA